jgi:starch-binding outer membrane protein, SusD/RagB family
MTTAMKKIYQVIFFLALIGFGSACADFLDETPKGRYTTENFYKTEEHALLAITGVYNKASFVSTNNALWVFGDVASDDAVKGGAAGDQSEIQFLEEFSYSANNGFLLKIWGQYYEGITRVNYLLYYADNIDMDADLKARILGEAKFMRAYFYFSLVNIFGEIPLKIQPPLNASLINIGKSSADDVYAKIEADLLDAVEVLEIEYSGADVGRATQGAAWGLLAKARLYQEKWQGALDAIQSLEDLGIYSLQPVYKNNFIDSTQNSSELVFEIQHESGQIPKLGSHLNQWFGAPENNGYAFDVPLQDFVDEFEITAGNVVDPRLDYTVGQAGQNWINGEPFDPTWSATGYLQKKHTQPLREEPIIGDASLNYVYMRYADILLMKAEALNELNRAPEAVVPLNQVRKRARESYVYDLDLPGAGAIPANLLPDVAASSQASVRNAIRHERRVELGFEFHRFFDLMRYGAATAELALADTDFDYATQRYFPIPQAEVDANTAID